MSDRPDRRDIDTTLKLVIGRAEFKKKLSADYAWHRRYVLGIDRRLETVEQRLQVKNASGDPDLDKAVDMTHSWMRAQNEPENSIERAFLLGKAQEIMDELIRDNP
jgi:hypothetical protein